MTFLRIPHKIDRAKADNEIRQSAHRAFSEGKGRDSCPYALKTARWIIWMAAYKRAEAGAKTFTELMNKP